VSSTVVPSLDQLHDLRRGGIEAGRRLVEEQHLGSSTMPNEVEPRSTT
jgi:hypothetical protein